MSAFDRNRPDQSYLMLTTQGGNRPRFMGKRKYNKTGRFKGKSKGKIANVVKSVLNKNVEFKHYTLITQTFLLSSAIGQFNLLTGIEEGNDVADRQGRQIIVRSIQMYGVFYRADTTNICRLALVQEIENSASLGSDLWVTPSVNSLRKNETLGKYRVLWDKRINMDTETSQTLFKSFTKMNIKVKYNAVDGAPIKNNIFLVGLSDSTAATHPFISFDVRVYYTDM